MQAEQLKILKMVEEGIITADEAQVLLAAMEPEPHDSNEAVVVERVSAAAEPTAALMKPADFERFRSLWTIPFTISIGVLVVSTILFLVMILGGGWISLAALLCMGPLTSLALIATLLSIWSKYATWVHVRVQEQSGRLVAISVPAPLRIVRWGIGLAAERTSKEKREQLLAAQELLYELNSNTQPLVVDVNDEDGDHVQIYIG